MTAKASNNLKRSVAKVEKPTRPTSISTAQAAHNVGVTDRQIRQMVLEGTFPKPISRGRFDEAEVDKAGLKYWRGRYHDLAKRSDSGDRLKAADAGIKEIELAERMRTVCRRDDYKNNYADAIAQGVQNIMGLTTLSRDQKEAVFKALRDVKLPGLEDEA